MSYGKKILIICSLFVLAFVSFANSIESMSGVQISIRTLEVQQVDGYQLGVLTVTDSSVFGSGFPYWRGYVDLTKDAGKQIFSNLQLALLNNSPVTIWWEIVNYTTMVRKLAIGSSQSQLTAYKIKAVQ